MTKTLNILHTVEFYYPSVGGMQEVVRQLSERFIRRGHQVTVATSTLPERHELLCNGVRIEQFEISGNQAKGMTGEVDRYRNFVLNGGFDVVTCFAAQQWATDALLTVLNQIDGVRILVPTGFSGLYLPQYREYFEKMKEWLRCFDKCIFLSEHYRDIDFARESGYQNISVIPNGASEDEFLAVPSVDIRRKLGIPLDHLMLLHVGSHTGIKGHHEAMQIFSKARIKNATFLVIANDFCGGCALRCLLESSLFNLVPKRLFDGKFIKMGHFSREETVAAYHAADLFLFPSNIECSPLVLFECLASKTPFLTTDVGNAAEIVEWSGSGCVIPTIKGNNGFVRADIRGAAQTLEDVAADTEGRRTMADSGFIAWRNSFTWEKISNDYEVLYRKLLTGKREGR